MALSWQDPSFFATPTPTSVQSPNPFDTPKATKKSYSDEKKNRRKSFSSRKPVTIKNQDKPKTLFISQPKTKTKAKRKPSMLQKVFHNLKQTEVTKRNDSPEMPHVRLILSPVNDEVKKDGKNESSESLPYDTHSPKPSDSSRNKSTQSMNYKSLHSPPPQEV